MRLEQSTGQKAIKKDEANPVLILATLIKDLKGVPGLLSPDAPRHRQLLEG